MCFFFVSTHIHLFSTIISEGFPPSSSHPVGSNGMAMKWLRTAKPSVHSSRSLTALDEPLACERATE